MKAVKDHPVHESWTLSPSRWTHPDLGGFWKTVTEQQHCSSSNSSSSSEADVLLLICLNTKFVKTCFTVGNLVYARQSADLLAKRAHYIGSANSWIFTHLWCLPSNNWRRSLPGASSHGNDTLTYVRLRQKTVEGARMDHAFEPLGIRHSVPKYKTELTFKRRSHCRVR